MSAAVNSDGADVLGRPLGGDTLWSGDFAARARISLRGCGTCGALPVEWGAGRASLPKNGSDSRRRSGADVVALARGVAAASLLAGGTAPVVFDGILFMAGRLREVLADTVRYCAKDARERAPHRRNSGERGEGSGPEPA
ncbi:hypothetical protein Busp01_34190 [Trinickia caryophylli]|nr:hypothetical protein C0Z17_11685 [Trinickia caryophylli]GLU33577.1 hypothetical protein Busp01_34190 [Trinickia caryophylli]